MEMVEAETLYHAECLSDPVFFFLISHQIIIEYNSGMCWPAAMQ